MRDPNPLKPLVVRPEISLIWLPKFVQFGIRFGRKMGPGQPHRRYLQYGLKQLLNLYPILKRHRDDLFSALRVVALSPCSTLASPRRPETGSVKCLKVQRLCPKLL
jgi:hypothetical protein